MILAAFRQCRSVSLRSRHAIARACLLAAGALLLLLHAPLGSAQAARGPTCMQGFVWREAYPGDYVCVTPQMREFMAMENSRAEERREPGGGAYGPDTCRQGYVWREARPGDHVCVHPAIRERVRNDNALAPQRVAQQAATGAGGDARCDRYARRAVAQFQYTRRPGCGVRPDGRWQDNFDAHYQWCLGAPDAWLASEDRARSEWLSRCSASATAPAPAPVAAPAPAPVTAPAPAPSTVVVRVDEQCDQYAKRAVRQFRLTASASCRVRPDGRWQDNYDAHYQWCLRAPQNARASEQDIRDQWLNRCGAQSRID